MYESKEWIRSHLESLVSEEMNGLKFVIQEAKAVGLIPALRESQSYAVTHCKIGIYIFKNNIIQ